jgi:hypothetical protein
MNLSAFLIIADSGELADAGRRDHLVNYQHPLVQSH